jgi:hypothetical protein
MSFVKQSFKTYALLHFYLKNLSETSKSYFSPKNQFIDKSFGCSFSTQNGWFYHHLKFHPAYQNRIKKVEI